MKEGHLDEFDPLIHYYDCYSSAGSGCQMEHYGVGCYDVVLADEYYLEKPPWNSQNNSGSPSKNVKGTGSGNSDGQVEFVVTSWYSGRNFYSHSGDVEILRQHQMRPQQLVHVVVIGVEGSVNGIYSVVECRIALDWLP